jgi:hypothetical protein
MHHAPQTLGEHLSHVRECVTPRMYEQFTTKPVSVPPDSLSSSLGTPQTHAHLQQHGARAHRRRAAAGACARRARCRAAGGRGPGSPPCCPGCRCSAPRCCHPDCAGASGHLHTLSCGARVFVRTCVYARAEWARGDCTCVVGPKLCWQMPGAPLLNPAISRLMLAAAGVLVWWRGICAH